MKKTKYMQKFVGLAALMLVMFACSPEMDDKVEIGLAPTENQLDFTTTPTAAKVNIIDIKNTSEIPGIVNWDFGNNTVGKGESATVEYPFKGTYTVVMTLYSKGGSTSKSKTITIENDDMSLLETPMYNALTGGASNTSGKTWVFDQYNAGHFGVFPNDNAWSWYAKAEEKDGSSLYSQEFTFTQVGVKFNWTNNGSIYTNAAGVADLAGKGYTNAVPAEADDFDVTYAPLANYTFALNETEKTITLSNGAFFGFYAGTSTYKIITLTEDVLELQCASTIESGNNWVVRLIPKEKNIKPVIIIPLEEIALSEDFESATAKVAFNSESMGTLTNAFYSNPAPVGINKTSKVSLYEKSGEYYSNMFFKADGYKFDLSEQNKVTLKVFIPSYNDYTTEFDVAGSWVSNKKLLPQVAIKLQNGSLGGDAYTTQTEIVKANLETDKWIELTFDFSAVSSREDYDKIVIQFGAEGHKGSGIFFFDDFTFGK